MSLGTTRPVYCMHCRNWYASIKANQCNIDKTEKEDLSPNIAGFKAVVNHNIYGTPSELNKNNDCSHYKEIGLLYKLSRRIFFGIPLKQTVESKIEWELVNIFYSATIFINQDLINNLWIK